MTIAELTLPTKGLIYSTTDEGTSPEAGNLRDWVRHISDAFSRSFILGEHPEAVAALNDVYREASLDDWDGYGGKPVEPQTYEHATLFLRLMPTTLPAPDVSADPDGEISFEWHHDANHTFSVSVGPGRRLTYAGLFGRAEAHGTEYLLDELPREILDKIIRLSRLRI